MKILITGAGHGIGQASAIELRKRGHTVVATDLTPESLQPLVEFGIECIVLDIANEAHWTIVEQAQVDVVICNGAIGESGPYIEIPMERLRKLFDTNVLGTVGIAQAAAKHMLEQKSGRIVIVGSTAGLVTLPMLGPYNSTKFALESVADAMRMELKQFNISVSLIEPGKIKTGFNQRMTDTKYNWLHQSHYANQAETQKIKDAQFFSDEYPVQVVVKGIVHAVESSRPKARYVTPPSVAVGIRMARMLPDRLRDWVLAKLY